MAATEVAAKPTVERYWEKTEETFTVEQVKVMLTVLFKEADVTDGSLSKNAVKHGTSIKHDLALDMDELRYHLDFHEVERLARHVPGVLQNLDDDNSSTKISEQLIGVLSPSELFKALGKKDGDKIGLDEFLEVLTNPAFKKPEPPKATAQPSARKSTPSPEVVDGAWDGDQLVMTVDGDEVKDEPKIEQPTKKARPQSPPRKEAAIPAVIPDATPVNKDEKYWEVKENKLSNTQIRDKLIQLFKDADVSDGTLSTATIKHGTIKGLKDDALDEDELRHALDFHELEKLIAMLPGVLQKLDGDGSQGKISEGLIGVLSPGELIKALDKDGDGNISLEEFVDGLCPVDDLDEQEKAAKAAQRKEMEERGRRLSQKKRASKRASEMLASSETLNEDEYGQSPEQVQQNRMVAEEMQRNLIEEAEQERLIAEELRRYEEEQDRLIASGELIHVYFSLRQGEDGPAQYEAPELKAAIERIDPRVVCYIADEAEDADDKALVYSKLRKSTACVAFGTRQYADFREKRASKAVAPNVVSSYEELRYWNRLKPGKRFPSALILIDMLPKNARFKDLQMQLIKTARGANAIWRPGDSLTDDLARLVLRRILENTG